MTSELRGPKGTCPLCWHVHEYSDEDCVSCGCTAAELESGALTCAHCRRSLANGLDKHLGAVCVEDEYSRSREPTVLQSLAGPRVIPAGQTLWGTGKDGRVRLAGEGPCDCGSTESPHGVTRACIEKWALPL